MAGFQAGAEFASSLFLLQLLIPPGGDVGMVLDALDPPVRVGLSFLSVAVVGRARGLNVLEPLMVLLVLGPLLPPKPDG